MEITSYFKIACLLLLTVNYKKINFYKIPLKIIEANKDKIISFFYPSTIFINEEDKSEYSKIKKLAEISLKK